MKTDELVGTVDAKITISMDVYLKLNEMAKRAANVQYDLGTAMYVLNLISVGYSTIDAFDKAKTARNGATFVRNEQGHLILHPNRKDEK